MKLNALFFKHYPTLRKKWGGELTPLGPYTDQFGPSTVVRNSKGDTMAVQDRYLPSRNPRIPRKPTSKTEYFLELVSQLHEWMFTLSVKPGPVLKDYFIRTQLNQAVKDLQPTPADREYLVVDFDVLPALVMSAAEAGVPEAGLKRLVNRITVEIIPFLDGDPGDWWLGYILPQLHEKGFVSKTTIQGAQMAREGFLAQ